MPRHSLLIATALLLVGSGAFLVPAAEAQVGTSSLRGTVCAQAEPYYIMAPEEGKGCYGGPLPNATLRLTRAGPLGNDVGGVDATVTSGADGSYLFERLPDGAGYTLQATRARFERLSLTLEVKGETHQDVPMEGMEVRQEGRVVGKDDRPIAGASVSACCAYREGWYAGQEPVTTDADGRFALDTVAGYLTLSVDRAPGHASSGEHRLLDGTFVTVRLEPLPPPDGFVQGTVRDQDGEPVAGAQVSAYSYGGCCAEPQPYASDAASSTRPAYMGGSNHTTTGADGRYRVGVYAGSVSLTVSKEGHTSRSHELQVERGETQAQDVRILEIPERTARIVGRVTGGGDGLQAVQVAVRSPEFGTYAHSCNGLDGGYGYATPMASGAEPMMYPAPDQPTCAITVGEDGSFEGMVTPGYSIVEVHYQRYLACAQTQDADGRTERSCGPDYYSWSGTVRLAADGTTRVDVALVQRPGPDATLSGYVLDGETGEAIPGATVWIHNQDNGASGSAETDGDGSYRVRLRSGYHAVTVGVHSNDGSPSGYLTWQGVLEVPEGDNSFDVTLTPGEEMHGGCCIAYDTVAVSEGRASAGAPASGASGVSQGGAATMTQAPSMPGMDSDDSSAQLFEDLGGGLGPYDASKRGSLLQAEEPDGARGSPGIGLLALVAAFGLAAWASRRRAA